MKLHLQHDGHRNVVHAYGPQGIVIHGKRHAQGLLVGADWLHSPWGPEHANALQLSHFAEVLARKPDIVLLGTGKRQYFPLELMRALRIADLAVEVMDTSAACRTYNILLAEDRVVIAALLPPEA
ncbi:MTH938/NDUFAF3 family protein [Acidithiobacillus sp.]|uniref:Mth938-like domain-containing protein n=1 Tax=Acidithiobacillus sp. TaxID=1872118 RepID=UPI002626F658|nr:MTH938/NDUFAF3 family protein [Acidithiobacillus sp.]